MKYVFIHCPAGHCEAMSREGGRIVRSSGFERCAACFGSISLASMHGLKNR
jgi:hypothetical protein